MTTIEVWRAARGEDIAVGTLHVHAGRGAESYTFSYRDDYLRRPDAAALEPALPLSTGAAHSHGRLFGCLADASPDRWGRTLVRRTVAAAHPGTRTREPLESDFLLGVRDDLRQGDLRLRLPTDVPGSYRADAAEGVPALTELGTLLALADKVLRDEADLSDLRRLVGAGSSLGGARPKAHVLLPGGAVGIAKFPAAGHDEWNVMAWEKTALDLAGRAGLTAPASRLVPADGRDILVVERFDRREGERVGYISAMTMLELSDGDRASYLDIAEIIEEQSPQARQDLRELWRRIVFGICINNTDDHLRNHGFLRGGSGWRLAPAFDLNPTPYATAFATDIADPGDGGDLDAALAVAAHFRLTTTEARRTIDEVSADCGQWRSVALGHGLSAREVERMAPAFAP